MTDLSQRELFDAIERSLRRTGRRFTRTRAATLAKKAQKPRARAVGSGTPSKKSATGTVRRRTRAAAPRT